MRTANFRDNVLWAVAYKLGLDPTVNLLRDQARAIASYVNAWVRRLWDAADWPEWTIIAAFVPANHIVPYDTVIGAEGPQLGRVLKVYLVDPASTPSYALCDTPFRLTADGIHVGFEHGNQVWIKYLPFAPQFTSDEWDVERTYRAGELAYLADTGECYRSIGNNNRGHYPGDVGRRTPIGVEVTQEATFNDPGLQAANKIIDIDLSTITAPDPAGTINYVAVCSDTPPVTLVGIEVYDGAANATPTQIRDGLVALLQGDSAFSAFTITALDNPVRIRLEAALDFSMASTPYSRSTGTGLTTYFKVRQIQVLVPGTIGAGGQQQFATVTLAAAQVIPGQTYNLTFVDGNGSKHEVSYTAVAGDTGSQILSGLIAAIETAAGTDDFFKEVFASIDPTGLSLVIGTDNPVNIDATMQRGPLPPDPAPPPPNPPIPQPPTYWNYVPFPLALVDQVVDGVYSDCLKEQGQPDKAQSEVQAALTDNQVRVGAFQAPQYDALTEQQKGKSRYAVK